MTGHTLGILHRLRLACDPDNPYVFVLADCYGEIQRERAAGRWHSLRVPINNVQKD